MWSSILVGTDGSPTAQEAVRQAAALAALCGARLSVCHAYQPLATNAVLALSGAGTSVSSLDPVDELVQQRADAERLVADAVADSDADPRSTTTYALAGGPVEVLLRVATSVEADLLVVGNRGMKGARRFLLGSVPNAVAHAAACSVLVVRTC